MLEKQLATLQGQSIMLNQQQNMIEASQFNQGIFEAIMEGKQVADQIQSQVNVDEMADLQADLQEQLDKQGEVDDFFQDIANQDADELADELAELEGLDDMEQMNDIGMGHIESNKVPSKPQPAQKVDATEDEEAELAAMMAV